VKPVPFFVAVCSLQLNKKQKSSLRYQNKSCVRQKVKIEQKERKKKAARIEEIPLGQPVLCS